MEKMCAFACAPFGFVVDVEAELLVERDKVLRISCRHCDVVYADC